MKSLFRSPIRPPFRKCAAIITFLSGTLCCCQVFAHVKWFVPDEASALTASAYSFSDTPVLIWLGIALVMISLSTILDSHLPVYSQLSRARQEYLISMLRWGTGLSLLMSAGNGVIFAPHLEAQSAFANFLVMFETVVGLLLMINFHPFAATILLMLLWLGVALAFGPVSALEYLNLAGIATCLLLFHFHPEKYRVHIKAYSIAALRILTGCSLVVLGLTEKLLNPQLGEYFVRDYMWNFMARSGIEIFSDQLFVFSAGVMEVVFGIILILGTTTRLNILVVSGFMLASNITFFVTRNYSEALVEIFGHLPIIATAIILIFFGSGNKLKITDLWRRGPADLDKFRQG